MRVADVMTTPVHTIAGSADAAAAWEQMRLHGIGHLVVVDEKRPTAVVSNADLGGRNGAAVRIGRRVDDLVGDKAVFVTPQTSVKDAANLMRGHGVDCLTVMDDGKLQGVVTASDLVELLGRGIERPFARGVRPTLKNRGRMPRGLSVAKRSSHGPHQPRRP